MKTVLTYSLLLILLFGSIQLTFAQNTPPLSSRAEISLLTCSPGSEVYSYFGHCAIRVQDPDNNFDKVYNYGTFNFSEPNFYYNFIKGRLMYYLSVNNYARFIAEYESDNRWVYEQTLNLSYPDKQHFFDLLSTNALPENRKYLYDFFFDNCATRPRDLLQKSLPNRVFFSDSTGANPLSFRQLIDPYINKDVWVDFGIDLILGYPTDRKASTYEYMFLPDYLMNAFAHAQLADSTGRWVPLVKNTQQLVKAQTPTVKKSIFSPMLLFAVLLGLGLVITYFQVKSKKISAIFDFLLFGVTGAIGILLLLLWFGTNHKVLAFNLNLLWAVPLNLPAAILLLKSNTPKWVGLYFGAFSFIWLLLLLLWLWLPQQLHNSLIFLVALMVLRAALLYKAYKASLNNKIPV